jgi:hypothetical protein
MSPAYTQKLRIPYHFSTEKRYSFRNVGLITARVTENFAGALEDVELDLVDKLSPINQNLDDDVKQQNKERYNQIKLMNSELRSRQRRDGWKKAAGIVEKLRKGEAEYDEKHATFEVLHQLPYSLIP